MESEHVEARLANFSLSIFACFFLDRTDNCWMRIRGKERGGRRFKMNAFQRVQAIPSEISMPITSSTTGLGNLQSH